MKKHRSLWAVIIVAIFAFDIPARANDGACNGGGACASSGSGSPSVPTPVAPANTAGESLNKARKEDDDETAYQLRVLEEQEKLDEKLTALSAFTKSAKFLGLPENQRILLERQQSVMAKYSQILR